MEYLLPRLILSIVALVIGIILMGYSIFKLNNKLNGVAGWWCLVSIVAVCYYGGSLFVISLFP